MRTIHLFQCVLFIFGLLFASISIAYQHVILQPIRWQGKKWEYLIEHPNKQAVDPQLFEEILDTAGLYGWELVEITDTAHFYVFYFKRPLLPHKLESQTYRVARIKHLRQLREAPSRELLHQKVIIPKENEAHEQIREKQNQEKKEGTPAIAPIVQTDAKIAQPVTTTAPAPSAIPPQQVITKPSNTATAAPAA